MRPGSRPPGGSKGYCRLCKHQLQSVLSPLTTGLLPSPPHRGAGRAGQVPADAEPGRSHRRTRGEAGNGRTRPSTRAASTPRACCARHHHPTARRGCAAISSSPASVPDMRTVAVIGSARLAPPDPRCVPAEQLGAAIAAQGWTVMTGGYGGLMEVTSRAAAQAGGRVIGLPMRGWSHLTPNRWNHELRWSDTYPERLAHLLSADAMVAVDGGIGTLSEATIAWAVLQTGAGRRGADLPGRRVAGGAALVRGPPGHRRPGPGPRDGVPGPAAGHRAHRPEPAEVAARGPAAWLGVQRWIPSESPPPGDRGAGDGRRQPGRCGLRGGSRRSGALLAFARMDGADPAVGRDGGGQDVDGHDRQALDLGRERREELGERARLLHGDDRPAGRGPVGGGVPIGGRWPAR